MTQFDLSLWLQDKSRKVVTRDGRPVRIICTDYLNTYKTSCKIIALVQEKNFDNEILHYYNEHGIEYLSDGDRNIDLFFADEKPQSAEFSFGAFDSEFVKDEYLIPEGCEARIEGNKVIIERVKKEEELSEFEKELNRIVTAFSATHAYMDETEIHHYSKGLLDLARKELEANYYTKVLDDRMVFKSNLHDRDMQGAYELGRQDALKDLPKWKKATEYGDLYEDLEKHVAILEEDKVLLTNYLEEGDYYIELEDLKTLPKEE